MEIKGIVTELPKEGGGGRKPLREALEVIAAGAGLPAGKFLEVACEDKQRAGAITRSIRRNALGALRASIRGTNVYVSRNGTH